MKNTHLEIAYWLVVKDLYAPTDIPVAQLNAILQNFLVPTGDIKKAGLVIFDGLSGIEWDWFAWHSFAKKEGYDVLDNIAIEIGKMRPIEILDTLTMVDLKSFCLINGFEKIPRSKKSDITTFLLKEIPKDAIYGLILPFRERFHEKQNQKCRAKMCFYMASRIHSIAYNISRYEQLNEIQTHLPYWKFVWGGYSDISVPKVCRKFDNKILPVNEARKIFPVLPCKYLQCQCRIAAENKNPS